MNLHFYKYQGTGNDFVMIDNREQHFKADTATIAQLCDRRFGVGGDGLILLVQQPDYDFGMVYYNADGNESSMCGNGGRCIVAFARQLGITPKKGDAYHFLAIDGAHNATINDEIVALQMQNIANIRMAQRVLAKSAAIAAAFVCP